MHNLDRGVLTALCMSTFVHGMPSNSDLPKSSKVSGDFGCKTVKYVVVDSHNIEPYNETVHGTGSGIRVFDKALNVNCYHQKRPTLSTRVDLELRDTRTEMALHERNIFTNALSSFLSAPFAWVSNVLAVGACTMTLVGIDSGGPLGYAGAAACLMSLGFLVLGTVYPQWQSLANAVFNSGGASASVELVSTVSDNPYLFVGDTNFYDTLSYSTISERGLNTTAHQQIIDALNKPLPLYHTSDNRQARVWHLFAANETHPIHVYHYGVHDTKNTTVKMWTTKNENNTAAPFRFHNMIPIPRGDYRFHLGNITTANKKLGGRDQDDDATIGQDSDVIEYDGNLPSGAPDQAYYGFDLYGDASATDEFLDDLGTTYDSSNGFAQSVVNLGDEMSDQGAWDTCICQQTSNSQWVATGSLQLSWDNTYNGYSECWNSDCDGA